MERRFRASSHDRRSMRVSGPIAFLLILARQVAWGDAPPQRAGTADDSILRAAAICAAGDILAQQKIALTVSENQTTNTAGTIGGWCALGQTRLINANSDVLGKTAAVCSARSALPQSAAIVDYCDGKATITVSALQAAATEARSRRRAGSNQTFDKLIGDAILPEAKAGEAALGAVTTTSDIIARAIAGFLEKRANAEFKAFILRRLRQAVCEHKDAAKKLDFQPWLPSMCAYLGKAEDDDSLPLSLGTGLRSALLQDAAELPDHVITNLLARVPSADVLLARAGFEAALALIRHRDPGYVGERLQQVGKDVACANDKGCADAKAFLDATGRTLVVVRSTLIGSASNTDIPFAARGLAVALWQDETLRERLVSALKTLDWKPGGAVDVGLADRMAKAAAVVERLVLAARQLNDASKKLDDAIHRGLEDRSDAVAAHAREVSIAAAAVLDGVDTVADATSELLADEPVKAAVELFESRLRFARSLLAALLEADLARSVSLVLTELSSISKSVPGPVSHVLSFAVDLATAKDAKEADAVIESIAAPVGAWRGKLEDTVFSLSSFVGAMWSSESTSARGTTLSSHSVGPVGAVGLDINLPARSIRPGLFLSIVDVGSLLSYAYDTGSTTSDGSAKTLKTGETTPAGFAQIFSPGAFLRFGLFETPVVVGGGISFIPRGRMVTITDKSDPMTPQVATEDRSFVRWSVFIAIDVTVFPFLIHHFLEGSMERRNLLVGLGLGALAGVSCVKRVFVNSECDTDKFIVGELPEIPTALRAKMADVLAFMRTHGWFDLLQWPSAPSDPMSQDYFIPRPMPGIVGLGDFAGHRGIHPGRPELSLLYHALASRAVTLPNAPADAYPTLAQLDTVENFISALYTPPSEDSHGASIEYVRVVLSYEYRPAAQTPHGRHADLVFSRTGIARVGQHPVNYHNATREFANWPRGNIDSPDFAATGARYALFLARRVSDDPIAAMTWEAGDRRRTFALPVRKLFSGDSYLGGANIVFSHQHVTERLQRLAAYSTDHGPLDVQPTMHNKPPFRRVSVANAVEHPALDKDVLVGLEMHGSCVVVTPAHGPLVRYAMIGETEHARLKVPPRGKSGDRQYTTLDLDDTGRLTELREGLALRRRANFIELRRPNGAPMLVNIRHKVDDKGGNVRHIDDFEQIDRGNYWTALFEDGICDGFIEAVSPGQTAALPAYSVVAAPDFFPRATGVELDRLERGRDDRKLANNFLKGGTIPLASVRLLPNLNLRYPATGAPVFGNDRLDDTATAVISKESELSAPDPVTDDADRRSGYLPDGASGIFYPGWDITYDEANNRKYLTTHGLGSPFIEDVKLCAAANGMWPASSPDSARTYQGSLVGLNVPGIGGYYYSRTATPLTDAELGYHSESPAAKRSGAISGICGWDGEYGPFLASTTGRDATINYANIDLVDQVQNAMEGKLDASQLRKLSTGELVGRMRALRRVIAAVDSDHEVYQTPYWLVSFESVERWDTGAAALSMPESLQAAERWGRARTNITGAGYFLVLAIPDPVDFVERSSRPRLVRPCKWLLVAQTCESHVAWYNWEVARGVASSRWSYA